MSSSAASPLCQERQSERIFQIFVFSFQFSCSPDFSLFSRFLPLLDFFLLFPDFWQIFCCLAGGTLLPWLCYWSRVQELKKKAWSQKPAFIAMWNQICHITLCSRVDKQRNELGRWKSRIVAIFLLFLTLLHVLT